MTEGEEGPKGDASAMIDANLKKVYDELLSEELPDRFKDLLAQLKKQDTGAAEEK